MRPTGKRYTDDFKRMIIEVYNSGKPVREICSEYGITNPIIYRWLKNPPSSELQKPIIKINDDLKEINKDKELIKLQKEIARIKEENEIFKKSYRHVRKGREAILGFIDENKDKYSVKTMCRVLEIARSTFYKFHNKTLSNRAIENQKYEKEILAIYEKSSKRYGAPKIHKTLEKQGYKISLKRVQRLMKKLNISSIVIKQYRPYRSNTEINERKNILLRDFSTKTINEKWVGDITYIHTMKEGWCYLASVMDLHTRKIIGYSFSKVMDTSLIITALKNAYDTQRPNGSVIFHSDLGTQYTSELYVEQLKKYNMTASYSRKGCPYDNACIESFHSILKKEEVSRVIYYDFAAARLQLFKYIEGWYNRQRIHGSIGYLTPQAKEDLAKASNS
ncbi:IS3 family transposase [Clostridium sp. YIM B02515]|uniref:IS3 family transposase n=1 Tax=Clostridium rhizosphaerae TaxID=2803861 RepID=A0ABS1T6N3_9CLOT|nr:IS3 family transposase [Clostridium rhizosphaerae]MBL4935004.1 IS3 family transposase [Clostridium rhizosphaerae]